MVADHGWPTNRTVLPNDERFRCTPWCAGCFIVSDTHEAPKAWPVRAVDDALTVARRYAYRMENVVRSALIVSPSTTPRHAAVAPYALEVGADFELRMGHHLGLIEETNGAGS
jgi:hypothetical protein